MHPTLLKRRLRIDKRRIQAFIIITILILAVLAVGWVMRQLRLKYGLTATMTAATITGDPGPLKASTGRTNLLILGVGGEGHEGGDLTDTLMVLSLDPGKKDSVLISLPRDIWLPALKDKINAAYHYGEAKRPGGGLVLAKATVEEVVGTPIHYALLVDFSGFTRLIDLVGGVEVDVAETFTDDKYPIAGKETDECNGDKEYKCRYEMVSFTKGREHMDGKRALVYVRSRHAVGDAGTDFSRGRRQQAIIMAFKNKVLSPGVLTNWGLLLKLRGAVKEVLVTDMNPAEIILLGRIAQPPLKNVRSAALTQEEPDQGKKGLLVNPPLSKYDGKWVLVPKTNGYDQIHKYINCVLENVSACENLLE